MMRTKTISKALEEIWEIKKRIYEEDKDCSVLESLKRAHKVTEQIFRKNPALREKCKCKYGGTNKKP